MIYLDNAATTFPKPDYVYERMDQFNRTSAVNAGRGSYGLAQEASAVVSDTKNRLRSIMHLDVDVPVVFSPSITVALNQIINGLQYRDRANIYVSPYEHNAVARTLHKVEKEKRVKIYILPVDTETYEIDLEKTKYAFVKNKPDYIFINHVSNVTGYILPVKEIFDEGKKYGSINVLDTAQSLGLIDFNAYDYKADIVAFAGHKCLYGPFGIGGFVNVSNLYIEPYITGGTGSDSLNLDMPDDSITKYEPASPNIVAIAGLQAALSVLDVEKNFMAEKELTDYLVEKVSEIKKIKIFVPESREHHVGIVSFIMEGYDSNDVGTILDEDYGICVRTGYHCAPYIHDVIKDQKYKGTVRVGLGQFNNRNDIDELIKALKEL